MDKVEELLTRGVAKIYPTKEELEKILRSGKKLTVYQGFDPTGAQLHIGHMMGLRKLKQWQDLGHHVIFLIGDFTGMIGDPSGKTSTRKVLSHDDILKNAKTYKEQAGKILRFTGENPVEVKFNGDWLAKMSAFKFLEIARLLSVQQVIERDMFQERQKKGEDVFMNEFLYPVMQAYDSVEMKVDVEVGGTDQMFNMLMGRKLMRHMLHKDKFVMTTPLLTDSQGQKIGKTEGNVIGLTDKPEELFGSIMALGDDVIIKGLEYLTDISMTEVNKIAEKLKSGEHPMQYKKKLAFEIVKQLHNEEKAHEAQDHFAKTVQNKEAPSEVDMLKLPKSKLSNATIVDVLVETKLADSKSDAKRLIAQGGVTVNDKQVTDPNNLFSSLTENDEALIQIGKRKFHKIVSS